MTADVPALTIAQKAGQLAGLFPFRVQFRYRFERPIFGFILIQKSDLSGHVVPYEKAAMAVVNGDGQ
ncbi:hypothetical protein CEV33_0790 [Brucella grignonensis]|uniref:Uncharacterized protein n=1 Tax=Brucella grignonensis TaxID=94627 RepID=A0A256FGV1_9HYPH|nr:hypothetical protein CEV33_0790 [Brucella grignonensis]